MTWQTIADAFFNYLNQGDLFRTAVYAPYSGMIYGIQLFWTILLIGLSTAVWIKTKDTGITAIVATVMFAILLRRGLIYPLALKAFYILFVFAIATGLFLLLRKKVY